MDKRPKIIKRYTNRKLYDTTNSAYTTLVDLEKVVRQNQDFVVMDNKSKADLTAMTLTQIIFDSERKVDLKAPVSILKKIIQSGDGSLSNYLLTLGAFAESDLQQRSDKKIFQEEKAHIEIMKQNLKTNLGLEINYESQLQKTVSVEKEDVFTLPGFNSETSL